MKTTLIALLLAAAACAAQAQTAEPGSIDAAMDVLPVVRGKVYTVINMVEFSGEDARIQAHFLQLTCNFLLKRDQAAVDNSGWRVESFDCKQLADRALSDFEGGPGWPA